MTHKSLSNHHKNLISQKLSHNIVCLRALCEYFHLIIGQGRKTHIVTENGKNLLATNNVLFIFERIHGIENIYEHNEENQCGQTVSQISHLNIPKRTTEVRAYECHVCKKAFIDHLSLKNHIRSHTGSKPYQCKECGKAFHFFACFAFLPAYLRRGGSPPAAWSRPGHAIAGRGQKNSCAA